MAGSVWGRQVVGATCRETELLGQAPTPADRGWDKLLIPLCSGGSACTPLCLNTQLLSFHSPFPSRIAFIEFLPICPGPFVGATTPHATPQLIVR